MRSSQRIGRVSISVLFAAVVSVGIDKLDTGGQRQIVVSSGGNPEQHLAFRDIWFHQDEPDVAATEDRAISPYLNNADTHAYPAIFIRSQGTQAALIGEYREAIRLDPQLAAAYYKLGVALRDLAHSSPDLRDRARRLRDACGAFMQGADSADIGPPFTARMHEIDALLNGNGRCPSE